MNECSLEEVQDALATQRDAIEALLLKFSKASDLEEARNVEAWRLRLTTFDGDMAEIIKSATEGEIVPFGITGKFYFVAPRLTSNRGSLFSC